jgi:hypothetical protein
MVIFFLFHALLSRTEFIVYIFVKVFFIRTRSLSFLSPHSFLIHSINWLFQHRNRRRHDIEDDDNDDDDEEKKHSLCIKLSHSCVQSSIFYRMCRCCCFTRSLSLSLLSFGAVYTFSFFFFFSLLIFFKCTRRVSTREREREREEKANNLYRLYTCIAERNTLAGNIFFSK